MQPIDHYAYWSTHKTANQELLDRERISLELMGLVVCKGAVIADLACGDGTFMTYLQHTFPETQLVGIDFSPAEVARAKSRGFSVRRGNFEKRITLKSGSIDIINAAEIIEHLYNPDHFLSEINRILKKGGYAVLSTPNLAAWFNRVFLVLGIQPLFLEMSTRSKLIGAGPLKRFKQGHQPVGHIRIFTLAALKDLFQVSGFELITIRGGLYEEGLPKSLLGMDRLFSHIPSLASNLIVLVRKTEFTASRN